MRTNHGASRATRAAASLLLALTAACNGDSDRTTPTTTSTTPTSSTVTSTTSPSTTAPPSPSTTARRTTTTRIAGMRARTPEEAATLLFNAWRSQKQAGTEDYARRAAVDELFRHPAGPPAPEFHGCQTEPGGPATCGYRYEGGGIIMRVQGDARAGWFVESVTFVAD